MTIIIFERKRKMELTTILSAICAVINAIVIGVVSNFDLPTDTKGPVVCLSVVAGLASLITALICCKKANWDLWTS